jgi:hypothetical protein
MNRNNSLIAIITLLITLFFTISIETQAQPVCPAIKERIDFSVKVLPKQVNYILNAKQNQLNQLAGKRLKQRSYQRVLGLTSTKQLVSAQMRGETKQISPASFCTRITSVGIKIKVLKLDVYVLGKYPRGSCQFDAIIDHEHEHVATYQRGVRELEREFNNKLWNVIRNLGPGIGSSPKTSSNAAFRNMKKEITAIQSPIEQKMKIRDRQIDTPHSYKVLTQQCAAW